MPAKKRSKGNLTEKERLAEARKALKQTQQVLNAELKKIDGYVNKLDWHEWFKI